jgi:anti-anti-sigma regulatory factor
VHLSVEQDGACVVFAEGDLTTYAAAELKETLLRAKDGSERIDLDFTGVGTIDLSCIQIIHSMFKTSHAAGKIIAFRNEVPALIERAFGDAGYGCGLLNAIQVNKEGI